MRYCPIARHFYRLRRVLIEELGLPRKAIRPSATFAELVPREQRRRVWERFRREKLAVEALQPSTGLFGLIFFLTGLILIALGMSVWSDGWVYIVTVSFVLALLTAAGLGFHWGEEINLSYTLGDAALATTTVAECQRAGYKLTYNEIFTKVRAVLVDACNVDSADIKPESKILGDLVDC